MSVRVRQATAEDYRALTLGRAPPPVWFGAVAEDEAGERLAMGKVEWAWVGVGGRPELQCWASFDRLGPVPAILVQRRVLAVFRALREAGEPAIYCYCNRALRSAEGWLRRLGFRPLPEVAPDPQYGHVWRCDLSS